MKRNFDEIKIHYETEKKLAHQLRNSTREQRKMLYASLYDELFQTIPYFHKKKDEINLSYLRGAQANLRAIQSFINKETKFLEIGGGDCSFAKILAPHINSIFVLEVSLEPVKNSDDLPQNVKITPFDGVSFQFQDNSVDIAFSNQVLEHIHPDDVDQHIQDVKRSLKKEGIYIIRTPHKFSGPHDISKYFDKTPTGFHLKEWSYTELIDLSEKNKFSSVKSYFMSGGIKIRMPGIFIIAIEYILWKLPYRIRYAFAKIFLRNIFIGLVK